MTSILVVEDDEQLRSAVTRDLAHRGFEVTAVVSVEDALSQLNHRGYDVLLTDLRMSERDGIDLLAELAELAPQTRPILMSAYASARDHQRAVELGAVQVLCKPFTSIELVQAIRQAVECETGFRGVVHGLSLVDVLQMFHYARRSLSVIVGGRHGGQIQVNHGEIVHAVHEGLEGVEALRKILQMTSGSMHTGPLDGNKRTIERAFEELLLDALRANDEDRQDDFSMFDEAFSSIEGALTPEIAKDAVNVSAICADVVGRVESALLCAVIDLDQRCSLGVSGIERVTSSDERTLIDDTVELIRNGSLIRLEMALTQSSAADDTARAYLHEVRVLSTDFCRFAIAFQDGSKAAVLVTRRDINPGLAFWYLRAAIPSFERRLQEAFARPQHRSPSPNELNRRSL
jgi:CheY-like chemotaxis protein